MKIHRIQVLRGPNIWSIETKNLIQLRLEPISEQSGQHPDVEKFKQLFKAIFPNPISNKTTADAGLQLAEVVLNTAMSLQQKAGMVSNFALVRPIANTNLFNVIFEYQCETAGIFAAKSAVELTQALMNDEEYSVADAINGLKEIKRDNALGPSTKSIVDAAVRRGIPWQRMGSKSEILLGYGSRQKRVHATITSQTSCTAVDTAANKNYTKELLHNAGLPVPEGDVCRNLETAQQIAARIGFPVAVKPLDGNHGRGVSLDVANAEALETAFAAAQQHGSRTIVERYVSGKDFRLLVINGKFVAASRRNPATVTGDGTSTIAELIAVVNEQPQRGDGHEAALTKIKCDELLTLKLKDKGLSYDCVLPEGQTVALRQTANLSTGGTATDVTDEICETNMFLAERVAALIGLDICGIDVIAPNLKSPLGQNGGVIIEVNAAPGLRMHLSPSHGAPRNVADPIIEMLFPPDAPATIPIFAITGTNGKTTTTRLLAQLATSCGHTVGYTTTDGIYIGKHKIKSGDCAGPASAALVLREPLVDMAILETARGGLLRAGLAFDSCGVGIITNIEEDHLGLADIETLEDMARVKAVVAKSVKKDGWAVLNAEDIRCAEIARELSCNIAFFALDAENEVFRRHVSSGGLGATVQNGDLVVMHNHTTTVIDAVRAIPLSIDGTSRCMIANLLTAAAAGFAHGFSAEQIRAAFETFVPCYELTPGRMNRFSFEEFEVLVDYAHNPHGLSAMRDYLQNVSAKRKIGIIAGIGDRRDEDTIEIGSIAAGMFDHIIVRQEHSLRGRTAEELNELVRRGVEASGVCPTIEYVADEGDAIRHALGTARAGDLIVALSDDYDQVIEVVRGEQQRRGVSV